MTRSTVLVGLLLAACGSSNEVNHLPDAPPAPLPDAPDASTCTIPADATVSGQLVVTADDHLSVWVNGELIDSTVRFWSEPQRYDVTLKRRGRNVIAIEGRNAFNTAGYDRGVLVDLRVPSLPDGLVVSGAGFKLDTELRVGWEQVDYNDGGWPAPVVLGPATMSPWGDVFANLAPGSTAEWMWSYDSSTVTTKPVTETVYVRRAFQLAAPGCD
jgi:hypothetical protein